MGTKRWEQVGWETCAYPLSADFPSDSRFKNDIFSWLLDYAPEEYKTVHDMVLRVVLLNVGSIDSTSMVSTLFSC